MSDNARRTLIENGTEIEGSIKSQCPVALSGKINGKVAAPALTIAETGSVSGRVEVKELRSQGEISGEIHADSVELSGKVKDDTVIQAKSLEVKLAQKESGLKVSFGNCRLEVGDPASRASTDKAQAGAREQKGETVQAGRPDPQRR